jgi:hypothetical protein
MSGNRVTRPLATVLGLIRSLQVDCAASTCSRTQINISFELLGLIEQERGLS